MQQPDSNKNSMKLYLGRAIQNFSRIKIHLCKSSELLYISNSFEKDDFFFFFCAWKWKERRGPITCYNTAASDFLAYQPLKQIPQLWGSGCWEWCLERPSTWGAPALIPKESPRAGITTLLLTKTQVMDKSYVETQRSTGHSSDECCSSDQYSAMRLC